MVELADGELLVYVLFERRGSEEYLATFPEFLERVRLPMEVDLRACNLLPAPPVVEWLEAEVWHDFVDMFEATIGAETESLMRLREQATLTDEQRNDCREWALLKETNSLRKEETEPEAAPLGGWRNQTLARWYRRLRFWWTRTTRRIRTLTSRTLPA